ncbi:unnamed protein product [Protopolystoma xenopodis]|uniref:Uncharacterized protein n=1 Tax=Protopolystoma xenopodis TaxID=117903 RepID=A0A3S5FFG1_9PLAT|nr:unnamed protein product [Protopolystoma xenopodis]
MMLGKAVGLLTAALVGLGFEVIEVRLGKPGSTAYFTFYAGLVLLAGLHTELGLGVQLPTGFRGLVEATIFAGRAMHSLQTSEITSSQLAGVARSLDAYLAAACAGLLIYRDAIRAAPGLEYRCLLIGQMTSGLVLLQAVWIWQTAAMIDPWHSRPWIQSGHKSVIFATLIFSVQMLLVLVGQNGLLVGLRTRRRRRPNMSDRPAATRAHRLMVEGNPRTLVYTSLQRRLPA